MQRRAFVYGALASAGAGALAGANDRIRVAILGLGWRGGDHMKYISQIPGVELATFCDVDEERGNKRAAEFEAKTGKRPKVVADLRRVMDDREIDAVTIATCNHWHALAGVWACQAGKHVYVEKPLSHNLWEGRQLVEAARRYDRIMQGGTQKRSNGYVRRAIHALREGAIGDVYMARCVHFQVRDSLGFKAPEPPPANLHWDLWLGPAPEQPFHRNLVHYNWHWFWDFGGGELANNGVHMIDVARWGLGQGLPTSIHASGGRFGYKDQGQTPNTLVGTYEYPGGVQLVTEVRGRYTPTEADLHTGVTFFGSKGYLVGDWAKRGKFQLFLGKNTTPEADLGRLDDVDRVDNEQISHFQNFFDAVRAHKREMLTAEVNETHLSTGISLLGNISYRLGRKLHFDPQRERFTGDSEADAMLTRTYRKPYVVPEKV
ncbi:MAG TPA: Gfo/Idh/MocA family oxidoreductase [Bryobacteraceae bacterium]|nr:Gfo/Idh/MocA family oxidoreductase [Bryobacteraceae bacterium]